MEEVYKLEMPTAAGGGEKLSLEWRPAADEVHLIVSAVEGGPGCRQVWDLVAATLREAEIDALIDGLQQVKKRLKGEAS